MKIIRLSLKIFKPVFIGILMVVLLLNLINIYKRVILKEQLPFVFGYGNAIIVTGSMAPAINPGDVVIISKQREYKSGDIVTYQGNNTPVTHRILEQTPEGYITGGDANNTDDGEVEEHRIMGKVVKVIPNAGNIILFLQRPLGMLIMLLGLFAMIEAPRLAEKIRKKYQMKGADDT